MSCKFQKLTPADNMPLGIYEEVLTYALSEADIRNIAVSGAYGAGKSSVIETYEKKTGKEFLHVSLAHFEKVSQDGQEEETKADANANADAAKQMEIRLEGKIINQLVHQIDQNKIPLTNFKVKSEADKKMTWIYTLWGVSCGLLLLFIMFHKKWKGLMKAIFGEWQVADVFGSEIGVLIAGIVLIILGVMGTHTLVKMQSEKKMLKKIVFKDTEVEILQDCKDSFFDSYLNEVLYLFEHVDAEAIVFEDMDRYGSNTIFVKLREINTLLDKRKKSLKFIYLLRDDMFENSDRTKFFDFIIPVVPVIDSSNSYDKFLENFNEAGIADLFSQEFLKEMSLFIDDMRILKNIQNEFLIYKDRVAEKPAGHDNNKLLAMIAYKNLFPKDFSNLQVRKGYVYTLFDSKDTFRTQEIQRLEQEIQEIDSSLREMEKEVCRNVEELDALFFASEHVMRVNNKVEKNFPSHADFVKALQENSDKVDRKTRDDFQVSWQKYDPKPIFDKFQNTEEYKKRKQIVESRTNKGKAKLYLDKKQKEERIQELKQAELKNLISDDNKAKVFGTTYKNALDEEEKFESVKRSPYFQMIQYLIREGYIDETYADYMTYFYENSISAEDRAFLRSVFSGNLQPYNYPLRNPGRVIEELSLKYFARRDVFNFNLLDFLLENGNKCEEKLHIFLHQIHMDEPDEFVAQYLISGKKRRAFTCKMNQVWEGMCGWILTDNRFMSVKANYVIDTLCSCSPEVIKANDETGVITMFLEHDIATLDFPNEDVEKVIEGIKLLNVKIKNADPAAVNVQLFKEIYQNHAYVLNAEMAETFYLCFYKNEPLNLNWPTALTDIFREENQPLGRYVRFNIACFIKIVLEREVTIKDDENVILYILNEDAIEKTDKELYIKRLETTITSLEDVNDITLWPLLMRKCVVASSADNMCDYFFESGNELDENLIAYINNSEEILTVKGMDLDELYGEKSESIMFDAMVECKELESNRYEKLVDSFGIFYTGFNVEGLPDDKMQILLRTKTIQATVKNIRFLREKYPESIKHLIKYDTKEYLNLVQEENIFEENELMHFMNLCPVNETFVNEEIIRLTSEHLEYVLQEKLPMKKEMREVLLRRRFLDKEKCKALIAAYLSQMTKSEVIASFNDAELDDFLGLLYGKRPSFEKTEVNEKLLDVMQKKGLISSYGEDKLNSGRLKAYGRRTNI